MEAVGPRVTELLAADPNPGNPVGAGATFAYCFALVLDGRIERGGGGLLSSYTTRRCGPGPLLIKRSPRRSSPACTSSPADRPRPGTLADGALASCLEIGQTPLRRDASFRPPCSALAVTQLGDLTQDQGAARRRRRSRRLRRSVRFDAQAARTWMHAACRGAVRRSSLVRSSSPSEPRRRASTRSHCSRCSTSPDWEEPRSRPTTSSPSRPRATGRTRWPRGPMSPPCSPGTRRRLGLSADRFEAMGAILHAADAAAQEASLHAAEGRKGSAATAHGRASVLMARCEGAGRPRSTASAVDPARRASRSESSRSCGSRPPV